MTNLIDRTKELAELAPKPHRGSAIRFERLAQDIDYHNGLREAAPAMLAVLDHFEPGDLDSIDFMLEYLCDDPNDNRDPEIETAKKVLHRLRKAAELMESHVSD